MGYMQKLKDWYTGSDELDDPSKRETLGKLLTGLEALVIGGSIVGLAKKVGAGEQLKKVPGLDYEFDGGVYIWGESGFPKHRFKYRRAYKKEDGDLERLFTKSELYNFIGKHIEPKYKSNELIKLAFDDDNPNEIGVSFKIGKNYYIGFQKINRDILKIFQQYNIE